MRLDNSLAHRPCPSSPPHPSTRWYLHQRGGACRDRNKNGATGTCTIARHEWAAPQLCLLCRFSNCIFCNGKPKRAFGRLRQGYRHRRWKVEWKDHPDAGSGLHGAGGTHFQVESGVVWGVEFEVVKAATDGHGFQKIVEAKCGTAMSEKRIKSRHDRSIQRCACRQSRRDH